MIRADFNFSDINAGIKKCVGYIIGEFTPTEEGGNFKPVNVIIQKLFARSPDFAKVEQLAIMNCKVIYD